MCLDIYLTVKVEPGDQESCMKRMTLTVTTFGEVWWFVLDKNGDGCCVDFPVEMRTAVKFSPIMYSKCSDGRIVERLRSYSEIVYVILLKRRC